MAKNSPSIYLINKKVRLRKSAKGISKSKRWEVLEAETLKRNLKHTFYKVLYTNDKNKKNYNMDSFTDIPSVTCEKKIIEKNDLKKRTRRSIHHQKYFTKSNRKKEFSILESRPLELSTVQMKLVIANFQPLPTNCKKLEFSVHLSTWKEDNLLHL